MNKIVVVMVTLYSNNVINNWNNVSGEREQGVSSSPVLQEDHRSVRTNPDWQGRDEGRCPLALPIPAHRSANTHGLECLAASYTTTSVHSDGTSRVLPAPQHAWHTELTEQTGGSANQRLWTSWTRAHAFFSCSASVNRSNLVLSPGSRYVPSG